MEISNTNGGQTVNDVEPKPRQIARVAAPLRQQVVESIREMIATGEVKPGDRLVERELCDKFIVSRGVIREAARRLEAEGLVRNIPQRGLVVAEITADEAKSLYEARAALEALAGRLFALRASEAEIDDLRKTVEEVRAATEDGDVARMLAAKEQFYTRLMGSSHNSVLPQLLKPLHARIQILRGLSMRATGRSAAISAELNTILAAVTLRDGDAAARACQTHVENAGAIAISALSEDPVAAQAGAM